MYNFGERGYHKSCMTCKLFVVTFPDTADSHCPPQGGNKDSMTFIHDIMVCAPGSYGCEKHKGG